MQFFPIGHRSSIGSSHKKFSTFWTIGKCGFYCQLDGKKYNSKSYALFIAILSVLLITFIVLILVALTKVFASALNANEITVLAVIVLFVFGYMMFGGANAMVYTNTIQALIMIVVPLF